MSDNVSDEEQRYLLSLIAARYEWAYSQSRAEAEELLRQGQAKSCIYPGRIQRIYRPYWDELFPNTRFYQMLLERLTRVRAEQPRRSFLTELAILQGEQLYQPTYFDQLLLDNGIVITTANQATIAQALAAMSIPSYVGAGEIHFAEGEEGEWWWAGRRYNYRLQARVQNTQEARWPGERWIASTFRWYFSFDLPGIHVPARVEIEEPPATFLHWYAPTFTEVPALPVYASQEERHVLESLQVAARNLGREDFFMNQGDAVRATRAVPREYFKGTVSIVPLHQPVWRALFPKAAFYLVRNAVWFADNMVSHMTHYENEVVAWQRGRLYRWETFNQLLSDTAIKLQDPDIRPAIVEALVWVLLADFLGERVSILECTIGSNLDTYLMKVWTERMGLVVNFTIHWLRSGGLQAASAHVIDERIDKHIFLQQSPEHPFLYRFRNRHYRLNQRFTS